MRDKRHGELDMRYGELGIRYAAKRHDEPKEGTCRLSYVRTIVNAREHDDGSAQRLARSARPLPTSAN